MATTLIGEHTLFAGEKRIVSSPYSKVIIGDYCAIAPNIKIMTLNHDYNFPAVQGTFYKKMFNRHHPGEIERPPTAERTKGNVVIGNDVWIAEDVVILSGVTIGDGCCIGARSVVSKDLPPYSICVGTPCKPVKKRYSQEIIDFLVDLQWWC
jgi:acetyltransferase-like isoleucine patch superfamily enzyme